MTPGSYRAALVVVPWLPRNRRLGGAEAINVIEIGGEKEPCVWDSTGDESDEDTLEEARLVADSMRTLGFHPVLCAAFSLANLGSLQRIITSKDIQVVFNLFESFQGISSLYFVPHAILHQVCSQTGVPYTGSHLLPMYNSTNKLIAKSILSCAGIPTPKWFHKWELRKEGTTVSTGKFIIKPVMEGSSIGITDESVVTVESATDLLRCVESLERRLPNNASAFAEEYIDGREFNVSLIAGKALHPAELYFVDYPPTKPTILSFPCKWNENSWEYSHCFRRYEQPSSDRELLLNLKQLALRCWEVCSLE
ncbi:D-alanine--D-alanine ligase [Pelomyxa schiedti]|nr:D-alanine--D-alanine ligase [Pelomyxa schiedti]